MGLLIAIARKTQLNRLRNEYESKQINISRAKSELASKITDYQMASADFEQNSDEARAFNERIQRLNEVDKRLDEQLTKIQTQLQLIEGEYGQCDQMIQSNIQRLYAS